MSPERKERRLRVLNELHDVAVPPPEEPFNIGRGAVAEADPDDFRWRALQKAEGWKSSSFVTRTNPLAAA